MIRSQSRCSEPAPCSAPRGFPSRGRGGQRSGPSCLEPAAERALPVRPAPPARPGPGKRAPPPRDTCSSAPSPGRGALGGPALSAPPVQARSVPGPRQRLPLLSRVLKRAPASPGPHVRGRRAEPAHPGKALPAPLRRARLLPTPRTPAHAWPQGSPGSHHPRSAACALSRARRVRLGGSYRGSYRGPGQKKGGGSKALISESAKGVQRAQGQSYACAMTRQQAAVPPEPGAGVRDWAIH